VFKNTNHDFYERELEIETNDRDNDVVFRDPEFSKLAYVVIPQFPSLRQLKTLAKYQNEEIERQRSRPLSFVSGINTTGDSSSSASSSSSSSSSASSSSSSSSVAMKKRKPSLNGKESVSDYDKFEEEASCDFWVKRVRHHDD
jgi:hypothetical protein